MATYLTYRELLDAIGTPMEVADGLGTVSAQLVRMWGRRNSIPAEYWLDLIALAQENGTEGVTLEALAELARRRPDLKDAA